MKKIIIGGVAVLIGVSGFSNFFFTFLGIIAGALPILLIIGGALAFYLGYTDIQTEKDKPEAWAPPAEEPVSDIYVESDQKEPAHDLPEEPNPETSTVAEGTIESASEEDPAPEEDTEPEEANLPSAASTASAAPAFKGNATTLVFHSIDCKFSKGKKCTVEFTAREEAIDQGYNPCKVCKA